jgi:hypothetical protein
MRTAVALFVFALASVAFADDDYQKTATYNCGFGHEETHVLMHRDSLKEPWQFENENAANWVTQNCKPADRVKRVTPKSHQAIETPPAFAQSTPPVTPAVNTSPDPGVPYFGLALVVLTLLIYFIPTLVSGARGCKAHGGIVVVNIFLGWTFIGWVVALAWAASGEPRPKVTA